MTRRARGAGGGLFVGLLLGLFSTSGLTATVLPALMIGAAFGLLFAVVSYAATGGKRDFTSSSQVVASTYAVLCQGSDDAARARGMLAQIPPPDRPAL